MNYNYVLDGFFSYPWLDYGIIVIYLALIVVFCKKLIADKSWLFRTLITIVVPFVWVITLSQLNPGLLGYGRGKGIDRIMSDKGKLLVIDHLVAAGSKVSAGSPCYRLHILEPKTGDKIRRTSLFNIYKPGRVSFGGDTMILTQPDEVLFYSTATGKKINTWSVKTLPGLFPQLKAGIDRLEPGNATDKIVINSPDGNKWVLNIPGNSISAYEGVTNGAQQPTGKLYLDENGIRRDDRRFGTTVVTYGNVKGSDHKMMLMGPDTVLNRRISFLHGSIIAVSEKEGCFVIRDFDDTRETGAGFVCMSLDGQRKLWEVREKALRPGTMPEKHANTSFSIDEVNHIFFANLKNELFAINLGDGKVLWRDVL